MNPTAVQNGTFYLDLILMDHDPSLSTVLASLKSLRLQIRSLLTCSTVDRTQREGP